MLEIKKFFICESCKKIIKPKKGVIIKGDVFVVGEHVEERGGLICNENNNTKFVDIKETAFCNKCFKILVGLKG